MAVEGELLTGMELGLGGGGRAREVESGIPHLVQGVRLVRVLLPAALGGCTILLFLLQPLMLLEVLQGVRQRAQGSRRVLAPSAQAICKATPSPVQFPEGLLSPGGPLCLPGHPHGIAC